MTYAHTMASIKNLRKNKRKNEVVAYGYTMRFMKGWYKLHMQVKEYRNKAYGTD